MAASYSVLVRTYDEVVVEGKRLGRQVRIDSRSARFAYAPREAVPITDVDWTRNIPILDQGNVGSCTGNAMTGALGTDPLFTALPVSHPVLSEAEALKLYSEAEKVDGGVGYPPEDNGSSGTSVCTAARNDGLISGFQHAFGLAAIQQALMAGPVLFGVDWYDSFDTPDSNGICAISPNAAVRGGHEIMARKVDTERQLIGCDNSWGTSFGLEGSFWFSWDTVAQLMSSDGDCQVPLPLSAPAPTPAPAFQADAADTSLWQVAGPWSGHVRTRADLVRLQASLRNWAAAKGLYGA